MRNIPKHYLIIITAYCFQQISTTLVPNMLPFETCPSNDLKTNVQKSVNALSGGIPDLGIENLSKISIDVVEINKDGLFYHLSNVTVEGLKNTIIDKFWIDKDLKYIHVTFHTTYNLEADYAVDGYLFSLPVQGVGKAHIVKQNVLIEMVIMFDIKKNENGKDIINLKSYRYGFNQRDATVYKFDNLYDGDKVKSDLAHDLVNKNWRTVSDNFARSLFDKITDKIFNAIQIYLGTLSLDDIDPVAVKT